MVKSIKKILFISHDATRSGAPFVLLYLLQWLKKNTDYQFDLLLLNNGPLKEEFEKVAHRVYLVSDLVNEKSFFFRVKRKLSSLDSKQYAGISIGKKINVKSYDLIYGNTIVSLSWLMLFKKVFKMKVVAAIHELRTNMEKYYSYNYLTENLMHLDLIIAGSQAVLDNIYDRYKIPLNKIQVIHAFIPTDIKPNLKKDLCLSIGVNENKFIIGGIGNAEWRKGTELLVPLSIYFNTHHPQFNYHLLWIGGNAEDAFVQSILYDIEKAKLSNNITILGNTSHYLDYLNQFDVFIMLSREDPFPLVSLEASYLQKPIVMFEGTGGTAELLINGGGKVIPYLDIEALGETILELSKNINLRKEMGGILKKEVETKYNSEILCKKVLAVLESL